MDKTASKIEKYIDTVNCLRSNTDVSFSKLFKKDGWFARLVFIQLIFIPIYTLFNGIFIYHRNWSYSFALIVGHWIIGFLLWKKRTRSTITVAVGLLWILFAWKRAVPFFALVLSSFTKGASNSIMDSLIPLLIDRVFGVVIAMVLTVIWTRNLTQLKREYV